MAAGGSNHPGSVLDHKGPCERPDHLFIHCISATAPVRGPTQSNLLWFLAAQLSKLDKKKQAVICTDTKNTRRFLWEHLSRTQGTEAGAPSCLKG